MPTLIELATIEECAEFGQLQVLQLVDLNMNLLQYQVDKIDVARFNETAKKYGVYYTILIRYILTKI